MFPTQSNDFRMSFQIKFLERSGKLSAQLLHHCLSALGDDKMPLQRTALFLLMLCPHADLIDGVLDFVTTWIVAEDSDE